MQRDIHLISQIQDTPEQQNCCFNCAPCDDDQFLKNETLCEACPKGFWPNEEKTGMQKKN